MQAPPALLRTACSDATLGCGASAPRSRPASAPGPRGRPHLARSDQAVDRIAGQDHDIEGLAGLHALGRIAPPPIRSGLRSRNAARTRASSASTARVAIDEMPLIRSLMVMQPATSSPLEAITGFGHCARRPAMAQAPAPAPVIRLRHGVTCHRWARARQSASRLPVLWAPVPRRAR